MQKVIEAIQNADANELKVEAVDIGVNSDFDPSLNVDFLNGYSVYVTTNRHTFWEDNDLLWVNVYTDDFGSVDIELDDEDLDESGVIRVLRYVSDLPTSRFSSEKVEPEHSDTTCWRDEITLEMSMHNETFNDVVSSTLNDDDLDVRFYDGYSMQGKPFTIWTANRVYFPVVYDGCEWCASVSRNPDGKATDHIGCG